MKTINYDVPSYGIFLRLFLFCTSEEIKNSAHLYCTEIHISYLNPVIFVYDVFLVLCNEIFWLRMKYKYLHTCLISFELRNLNKSPHLEFHEPTRHFSVQVTLVLSELETYDFLMGQTNIDRFGLVALALMRTALLQVE